MPEGAAADFSIPVRVYYEDTDTAGVVYYANYLRFMERARTEWLRALGFEQDKLSREERIIFAVRAIKVDFFKPGHFNELLEASVGVRRIGGASVTFLQQIRRDTTTLCQAEVKVACLDVQSFAPRAIPGHIMSQLHEVKLS